MKTVAVISEYNPFHLGHAYQYGEIRRAYGEDAVIVAIMSGNFVQRGIPAVLGKFDRARMAVECGASLVLELPFPFSAASAEHFARAGVAVADKLGAVDVLSFGSECGDLSILTEISDKMASADFENALRDRLVQKEARGLGYPRMLFDVFCALYGECAADLFALPNNILAISYLSALKKRHSAIQPHTVLRTGTDKDSAQSAPFAGATHLRSLISEGKTEEMLCHIPPALHPLWREALQNGLTPFCEDKFSSILLSHLRMSTDDGTALAECGGGILPLLRKSAAHAGDLNSLLVHAATKKYTDARLRRAALFAYFGVTPAMLGQDPLYTQVLAMDERGRALLAHIRKTTQISILTKPADLHKLDASAREQATLSYRADSVYALCLPTPQRSDMFLSTSPYRK